MGKENRLFSWKENLGYRTNLFLLNMAAAMDINQLILARDGRVDEMFLVRAEELKQNRREEIERRKSIISNG